VVMADDHPIVRMASAELANIPICCSGKPPAATRRSADPRPAADVLLLDINMRLRARRWPGGGAGSPTRILVLAPTGRVEIVLEMVKAGVTGYTAQDEDLRIVRRSGWWRAEKPGWARRYRGSPRAIRSHPAATEPAQLESDSVDAGLEQREVADRLALSEGRSRTTSATSTSNWGCTRGPRRWPGPGGTAWAASANRPQSNPVG
jgi:DNA-binding NarL/FixJ family response regulator